MADETRDDLESGVRFLHVMGMQTRLDVADNNVRLDALLEELVSRGVVDLRSLDARKDRIRAREGERAGEKAHVQITGIPNKYALTDLPNIDCEARIPLCKGKCCSLTFALSFQDLDERVIRWDYGRPYVIKQRESDGYCVHNDATSHTCTAYKHRPAVCRTYDCREDKRIWLDFAGRIPAPEAADPATPGEIQPG